MSDRAPSLGWGHININVTDLDRSVAFYEKLGFEMFLPGIPYLGLSEEMNEIDPSCAAALGVPAGTSARACIMQLGQGFPKIDLIQLADPGGARPLTNRDTGIVRLCLSSRDLMGDHSRLSAAGVPFLSAPGTDSRGFAQIAVCSDPDGALIELIEIDRAKWAGR